jgi:hypothetical protein
LIRMTWLASRAASFVSASWSSRFRRGSDEHVDGADLSA